MHYTVEAPKGGSVISLCGTVCLQTDTGPFSHSPSLTFRTFVRKPATAMCDADQKSRVSSVREPSCEPVGARCRSLDSPNESIRSLDTHPGAQEGALVSPQSFLVHEISQRWHPSCCGVIYREWEHFIKELFKGGRSRKEGASRTSKNQPKQGGYILFKASREFYVKWDCFPKVQLSLYCFSDRRNTCFAGNRCYVCWLHVHFLFVSMGGLEIMCFG